MGRKKQLLGSDIPFVPMEVWTEILLRIPAEDVVRFKGVCKAWRELINSRSFARSHVDHWTSRPISGLILYMIEPYDSKKDWYSGIPELSYVNYEGRKPPCPRVRLDENNYSWQSFNPLEDRQSVDSDSIRPKQLLVLTSCDGLLLICYKDHSHYQLLVCNPLTGSHTILPEFQWTGNRYDDDFTTPGRYYWSMHRTASIGQYKILVMVKTTWTSSTRCCVLELQRHGSRWKELEVPLSEEWNIEASTIKEGKVHWLVTARPELQEPYRETKVLSMDILKEEFSTSASVGLFCGDVSYFASEGSFYSCTKFTTEDKPISLLALDNFDTMAWTEYRDIKRDSIPHLSRAIRLLDMTTRHIYAWLLFDFKQRDHRTWLSQKVLPHTNSLLPCD